MRAPNQPHWRNGLVTEAMQHLGVVPAVVEGWPTTLQASGMASAWPRGWPRPTSGSHRQRPRATSAKAAVVGFACEAGPLARICDAAVAATPPAPMRIAFGPLLVASQRPPH